MVDGGAIDLNGEGQAGVLLVMTSRWIYGSGAQASEPSWTGDELSSSRMISGKSRRLLRGRAHRTDLGGRCAGAVSKEEGDREEEEQQTVASQKPRWVAIRNKRVNRDQKMLSKLRALEYPQQ